MSGGLELNGINSKGTEVLIEEVLELQHKVVEANGLLAELKELLIEIREALQGE